MTDIMTPALGESVTEATVARWAKKAGEAVRKDELLVELETDKVSLEVRKGEMIALIGHELRHAVEVAEAGDVHDQDSLTLLYQRIGERGRGEHLFDTVAAQTTGRQVRKELLA